jgi:hypothetical protein
MNLNKNAILLNAGAVLVAAAVGGYFVRQALFPSQEEPCAKGYDKATEFVYERSNGQLFSAIDLQGRFGGKEWGILENTKVVRVAAENNVAVLEVAIPKGSINPNHPTAPKGGVGFRWRPSNLQGAHAACLNYSVFLPADFDFRKGGKLPGLFGGSAPAGGVKVDGKNGFSVRYMWRDKGDGEVYAYIPAAPEGRGISIDRGKFRLSPGKWNTLTQEVVLNDPGSKNGLLRVWLNGELVIEQKRMHYRDTDTLTIDGVMADVFYGGSDPSYAAPKDTKVMLSPFEVRWR